MKFPVTSKEVLGQGRNSFRSQLVRGQIRWLFRPFMAPSFSVSFQRTLANSLRWLLPQQTGVQTHSLDEPQLRGDRHVPKQGSNPGATIVYFHGGGYTLCSPASHRSLTRMIAHVTGLMVHVPQFRLAPEHPYPCQLEDAMAAIEALERQGYAVPNMVFAGDSTGAHLALTLAIARKDLCLSLPSSLVLISPCVDWSLKDLPNESKDALLDPGWVRRSRDGHIPPSRYLESLVSPIHANLQGLPRVLLQSASAELFALEAERLYVSLVASGVPVIWQEWQGLWHDFQMHAALVPEGRDAIGRMARFLNA